MNLREALTSLELLLQKKECVTATILERIIEDILVFIEYHYNQSLIQYD